MYVILAGFLKETTKSEDELIEKRVENLDFTIFNFLNEEKSN
jgi:hypothetical protein